MVDRTLLISSLAFVLACVCVAPAVAGERYVALGDSYSSGTGTRDASLDGPCERGRFAYPRLVADERPGTDLVFVACGGAKTGTVLASQTSVLDAATRWVTVTVGGNDVGFSEVLRACAKVREDCNPNIAAARGFIATKLGHRLDLVYGEIKRRSPKARTIVLGYPRLFGDKDCNAATVFTKDERKRLNETADLLRDKIRARVKAAGAGFRFQDAIPPFLGHAVCSRSEWLNGLSNPTSQSFHPNRLGHSLGYAPLVRAVMGDVAPARPPRVGR